MILTAYPIIYYGRMDAFSSALAILFPKYSESISKFAISNNLSGKRLHDQRIQLVREISPETGQLETERGVFRYFDPSDFVTQMVEIFVSGDYDLVSQGNEAEKLKIVDAGANIGLASIFFSFNLREPDIIVLEPNPEVAEVLRNNLAAFGVDARVVAEGLAGITREETLYINSTKSAASTFRKDRILSPPNHTRKFRGHLQSLVSILDSGPIDFLKMDIEGLEEEVILETPCEQLQQITLITFEYHFPSTVSRSRFTTVLEKLQQSGFDFNLRKISSSERGHRLARGNRRAPSLLMECWQRGRLPNYLPD